MKQFWKLFKRKEKIVVYNNDFDDLHSDSHKILVHINDSDDLHSDSGFLNQREIEMWAGLMDLIEFCIEEIVSDVLRKLDEENTEEKEGLREHLHFILKQKEEIAHQVYKKRLSAELVAKCDQQSSYHR